MSFGIGGLALAVVLAANAPASPIVDSGFESEGAAGRLSAWNDCGTAPATLEQTTVKSGRFAVTLGSGAAICQRVVVPTAASVLLDYWAHVTTAGDPDHAAFEVSFYDRMPDGTLSLVQPIVRETAATARGFAHYTFDVTALAGQTLVLYFGIPAGAPSAGTSVALDDVSFVIERPTESRP